MKKPWAFLAALSLAATSTSSFAGAPPYAVGVAPIPPGYTDPPAYLGETSGVHANGVGWTLGYYNIYDAHPYSNGWYWPNVHWPSRDYHFTYRPLPTTYRVFYPSLTYPRGNSYYITPLPDVAASSRVAEDAARIEVYLPTADAEVTIEGVKMQLTGTTRVYASPALEVGQTYTYDITASWRAEGQQQTDTKTVTIRRGDTTRVTFGGR